MSKVKYFYPTDYVHQKKSFSQSFFDYVHERASLSRSLHKVPRHVLLLNSPRKEKKIAEPIPSPFSQNSLAPDSARSRMRNVPPLDEIHTEVTIVVKFSHCYHSTSQRFDFVTKASFTRQPSGGGGGPPINPDDPPLYSKPARSLAREPQRREDSWLPRGNSDPHPLPFSIVSIPLASYRRERERERERDYPTFSKISMENRVCPATTRGIARIFDRGERAVRFKMEI